MGLFDAALNAMVRPDGVMVNAAMRGVAGAAGRQGFTGEFERDFEWDFDGKFLGFYHARNHKIGIEPQ